MRTTENTSNIRSLTDAELDEVSGGLLKEVWNVWVDIYNVAFFGDCPKYETATLTGTLHR
jgi:hypothetical protein